MDFSKIAAMAAGHAEARAIQTAVRLGLFDALASEACDAVALARVIRCEPRATAILADALASLGLLEKNSARYSLSAGTARHLVAASPEYLGGMILFDAALWDEWGRLEDAIRTGRAVRDPDMFQSDPAATERFIRAMDSLVRARGDAGWTAAHLNLARTRSMVDLGGGPGTYLIEFLRKYPELRGELWDLPGALAIARRILKERAADVIDRIELRQFDYHRDPPPTRVDAVFLSNIIHSENERDNLRLMHTCYQTLNPGGFVAIKDHVMDDAMTTPASGAVFSLYLLLTTCGRDYSFTEIERWLAQAGFAAPELIPLPTPPFSSSIITAVRP